MLHSETEFSTILKRVLPAAQYSSVLEALAKEDTESPVKKLSKSVEPKPKPPPKEVADAVQHDLASDEWIARIEAIARLKDAVQKSGSISAKALNCFVTALGDSDARVCMHTLSVLSTVVPGMKTVPDLTALLDRFVPLLNSMNTFLRNSTKDAFRVALDKTEPSLFVPLLVGYLQRPKDRAWLFLFNAFTDSLESVKKKQPRVLTTAVVPFVKSLAQRKVTGTAKKFIDKLHEVLGEELPVLLGDLWKNC